MKGIVFLLVLLVWKAAAGQTAIIPYAKTFASKNGNNADAKRDVNGHQLNDIAEYIVKIQYFKNGWCRNECVTEVEYTISPYLSYYETETWNELFLYLTGNKLVHYIALYDSKKKMIAGEYLRPAKILQHSIEKEVYIREDPEIDSLGRIPVGCDYCDDIKNGKWSFWEENGNLIRTELWDKGRLIETSWQ